MSNIDNMTKRTVDMIESIINNTNGSNGTIESKLNQVLNRVGIDKVKYGDNICSIPLKYELTDILKWLDFYKVTHSYDTKKSILIQVLKMFGLEEDMYCDYLAPEIRKKGWNSFLDWCMEPNPGTPVSLAGVMNILLPVMNLECFYAVSDRNLDWEILKSAEGQEADQAFETLRVSQNAQQLVWVCAWGGDWLYQPHNTCSRIIRVRIGIPDSSTNSNKYTVLDKQDGRVIFAHEDIKVVLGQLRKEYVPNRTVHKWHQISTYKLIREFKKLGLNENSYSAKLTSNDCQLVWNSSLNWGLNPFAGPPIHLTKIIEIIRPLISLKYFCATSKNDLIMKILEPVKYQKNNLCFVALRLSQNKRPLVWVCALGGESRIIQVRIGIPDSTTNLKYTVLDKPDGQVIFAHKNIKVLLKQLQKKYVPGRTVREWRIMGNQYHVI